MVPTNTNTAILSGAALDEGDALWAALPNTLALSQEIRNPRLPYLDAATMPPAIVRSRGRQLTPNVFPTKTIGVSSR